MGNTKYSPSTSRFTLGSSLIRRSAAVGLSLALSVGVLTGCASSSPAADDQETAAAEKVTLVMWQQWGNGSERDVLKALISRYEELNPNITIEETPVTNNAAILSAITGGNAPDIVSLGNSLALGGWASAGAVTDLTPFIEASGLDTSAYVQSAFNGLKVGGKTYALPFQLFNAGLIYNKQMFADAGLTPPTTLEELAVVAKQLTKVDSTGRITQLGFTPTYPGPDQGQTCPLIAYSYAFGGEWAGSDGTPTPNTPENVAALTWMRDLYNDLGGTAVTNYIASAGSYLTADDPLESGQLGMVFDGPWNIQYTKGNAPEVAKNLSVIPLPASMTSPASSGSTYIDANPQFIPTGSKHTQAAFDFIAWMTTNAEETATFSNAIANIPQLKTVPDYELQSEANYSLFVEIANGTGARSWVQTKDSSTYGTGICQAQDAVLLNGADPAEALAAIKTK